MSELTIDQIAASVERLNDSSALLRQEQLLDRLDPYRAGNGGSTMEPVVGASPFSVATMIAAGTITADEIAAGTITAAKIAANTITAGQIAAGTITADEIAAGAITSSKIAVSTDRANLVANGSFEEYTGAPNIYAYPSPLVGWSAGAHVESVASESTWNRSGQIVAVTRPTTGAVAYESIHQTVKVTVGRTYRLSGWVWKAAAGGTPAYVSANAYDGDGVAVAYGVVSAGAPTTATTPTFGEGFYTVPLGVASLIIVCAWSTPAPASTERFAYDGVTLQEVPAGARNTSGEVVIDATGVTITNGALTVTNPGSTVIIDGTSNMFKIVATGTQTATMTPPGIVTSGTAITALGTLSTIPAVLCYVAGGNGVGNSRWNSYWPVYYGSSRYAASTSGGAVTSEVEARFGATFGFAKLDGSSHVNVYLQYEDVVGTASTTMYERYYVLQETAM